MSRPYRIKLLPGGVLPYYPVGISGESTCGHRSSICQPKLEGLEWELGTINDRKRHFGNRVGRSGGGT